MLITEQKNYREEFNTKIVEFEINQTIHAEYENQITKVKILVDEQRGTNFLAMSFEYDDVLDRNRDDAISMINDKNEEILAIFRRDYGYITDEDYWRTCACKNGDSVDPKCFLFTVDPECNYGMCFEQRWYFYTSLVAGIDL